MTPPAEHRAVPHGTPGTGTADAATGTPRRRLLDDVFPRRDRRTLTVTAVIWFATAAVLVARSPHPALWPALVGLATFGTCIAVGDALTRRIPNRLNAAALVSSLPLLGLAAAAGYGSAIGAAAGAGAAFAVYAVLWLVAPGAVGAGDVKLAPYLGAVTAFLGWSCWGRALVLGMVLQGVVVAGGLLTRRLGRSSHVAHGPAMCLGAVLAVLEALSRW